MMPNPPPRISVVPTAYLDAFSDTTIDIASLLRVASGLAAETVSSVTLGTAPPQLLLHHACATRAQLLALSAFDQATQAAAASAAAATPLQASSRSDLYLAAVLQHAALLLLLLVSDSVVFVLPTETVEPSFLQLLHLLNSVHNALQQQQHHHHQSAAAAHNNEDSSSVTVAQLLARRQRPVQLHVALQAPAPNPPDSADAWAAVATSAVQRAQHTLFTCHALTLSPTLQQQLQQQQHGGNRAHGTSSLLFELVGVHCCCSSGGPNTAPARRRAILGAIQQQLSACSRRKPGATRPQQQQQQQHKQPPQQAASAPTAAGLPGLDQLLAHIISGTAAEAATAAAAAGGAAATSAVGGPLTQRQLQDLWSDLLLQLFDQPTKPQPQLQQQDRPSLFGQQQQQYATLIFRDITLTPDDVSELDAEPPMSPPSADSWGGGAAASAEDDDEGWEEVQQHDEYHFHHHHHQQQQHQEGDRQWHQQPKQLPGRLLASAVDPVYVASLKGCRRAALAALREYLQAAPPRYTAAVHAAVLRHVLQRYGSSAVGPAAPQLQEQLLSCCQAVWEGGRQQCSQVSLTGRPCVLSPHDPSQQSHSSNTQLQVCVSPDGITDCLATDTAGGVPDWFDVAAANVAPAQQLLQHYQQQAAAAAADSKQQATQGQKQQQQKQKQKERKQQPQEKQDKGKQEEEVVSTARLLTVAVKMVSGTGQPGHTSSSSRTTTAAATIATEPQQPASQNPSVTLGPWMSLWIPPGFNGSGASGFEQLPGSSWLAGFNKLLPLRVLAPLLPEPLGASAEGAAAGGRQTGQQQPQQQRNQQQQQQQLSKKPDFASQLKRKGAGAGGAAQSHSTTPEILLGPQDFPTLQQALGTSKKKQQGVAAGSRSAAVSAGGAAAAAAGATLAAAAAAASGDGQHSSASSPAAATVGHHEGQQQLLLRAAWPCFKQPPGAGPNLSTQHGAAAAGGETGFSTAAAAADRQPGGSSGSSRGGPRGGRGGKGGAATAAAGVETGAGERQQQGRGRQGGRDAPQAAVLATLWIGLEYESLSGTRMLLQPHQLSAVLQTQALHQHQQQQGGDASFAATAAEAQDGRHRRGGRHQQQPQQQQQQSTKQGAAAAAAASGRHASAPPAAAAGASGANSSSLLQGPAAALLQGHIPLYLTPGQLQLQPAGTSAASAAGGASSAGVPVVPLDLLQLQRVFVRTPAAPFSLACQPEVCLQRSSSNSNDPSTSSSGGSSATVVFRCGSEQVLPPDCLAVINLPKVYAAPLQWVAATSSGLAAAADAAVTVTSFGHEASAAAVSLAVDSNTTASARDTSCANVTAGSAHADTAAARGTESVGQPGGDAADNSSSSSQLTLMPLIPPAAVAAASAAVDSRSKLTSEGPTAAAAGCGGSGGGWSGWLCAGSWLYPAGQPAT